MTDPIPKYSDYQARIGQAIVERRFKVIWVPESSIFDILANQHTDSVVSLTTLKGQPHGFKVLACDYSAQRCAYGFKIAHWDFEPTLEGHYLPEDYTALEHSVSVRILPEDLCHIEMARGFLNETDEEAKARKENSHQAL